MSKYTGRLSNGEQALILDNCEVIPSLATDVNQLLENAPNLTIFTTGRHRLNLQSEVVLQLGGLQTNIQEANSGSVEAHFEMSDSVKLFVHCAQRIQPSFAVDSSNYEQVSTFCTLVGGLPLAIELGAMQLDFYSPEELIDAVKQNLDLLSTNTIDIPQGHRSILGVLTSTWHWLSQEAKDVLASSTIFANTWHREALNQIMPATRQAYRELINSSLMQIDSPGWFSLHPLVKQFVQEEHPPPVDVNERHAKYFLSMLDLGQNLREDSPIDNAIVKQLRRYKADLVASWEWAISNKKWDYIEKAVISYGNFLISNGQRDQGVAAYQSLLEGLNRRVDSPTTETRLAGQAALIFAHIFVHSKGYYHEAANSWYERSIEWLNRAGTPFEIATAHANYGYTLTGIQGVEQKKGVSHLEKAESLAAQVVKALNLDQAFVD